MIGYERLTFVDQFEASHDNNLAVRRACDVMSEYLSSLTRPLPAVIAEAIKMARGYRAGLVGVEKINDFDKKVSQFLKKSDFADGCSKEAMSIARATDALLKLLLAITWGGGASEVLANFLECVDEFERDHLLFIRLLEQFFGREDW